jgi:NSS family neurotransmitter:Na+ symporter
MAISSKRETFSSGFGLLMTMIGVAVGLGNVWRFPYMVGKFGGASFVLFYLAAVLFIGIPALMAEWALGRYTQRGTLGAFEKGGLPGGKYAGAFLVFVVFCATAYYGNTLGWVGWYAISNVIDIFGGHSSPAAILPPQQGFNSTSLLLQVLMTGALFLASCMVLIKGLKKGIERISKFFTPLLFILLIFLIIRSVTLPGAEKGLSWYLGGFNFNKLTGPVMAAALGQAIFSLSLGGTFMVVYGSYLDKSASIPKNAMIIGISDLLAGLMAGFAIFPAVFALDLEPGSGPGLIFSTLPRTFSRMPAGPLFGLMFFSGLFAAAFLSLIAAFEVLVAAITDNTRMKRKTAAILVCVIVFFLALPSMINMKIFLPWDLVFGSGMQTLGVLLATITFAWCIKRSDSLKEIAYSSKRMFLIVLYWWIRIVIPLAILLVGVNWLYESVF